MTIAFTNFIGYTAAIVGTFLMLPQVLKLYSTKKAGDVSIWMVIFYVVNCFLWLLYGIGISAMPVIVANAVALVISIAQLILKLRYDR
jgi:MtN3 and saliva related transmembrane protein